MHVDVPEYEINTAVLLYEVRWQFSNRGQLFFKGSYADTDAMFQSLSIRANEPDVINAYFPDGLPGPGDDPTSPLHFHDYDFSSVNTYSDLDYKEWRSRLGADYVVHNGIKLFASISYYDVEDNAPYIQDFTGSVTLGRLGAIWSF